MTLDQNQVRKVFLEGLRFCILSPCHVPRIIASA